MAAPYNDLGYTGEMYDAKAGLLDLSARWYNPGTGDFTSQDTYVGNRMDPMSLNRYAYTEDNPVNRVDPTGHKDAAITGGSGSNDDLLPNSPNNKWVMWGSRGPYVKFVQSDLNTLMNAGLVLDGKFGKNTYGAVIDFQKKYGLHVDGVVGNKTWGKLTYLMDRLSGGGSSGGGSSSGGSSGGLTIEQKIQHARDKFNQLAGTMPVIGYGASGNSVRMMQSFLNEAGGFNLAEDGVWGNNTQGAMHDIVSLSKSVGKRAAQVADFIFGISDMIHDVHTIGSNASFGRKALAVGDLAFTAISDIAMVVGVGEVAKAADLGVRGLYAIGRKVFGSGSKTEVKRMMELDLQRFASKGTTNNYVYISRAPDDSVQYVGITNNLARRAAKHLRTKGINIAPLMRGLDRNDARAVEQTLIEINGLGKNGGTLLNKINSISKSNPSYARQLERGYRLLESIGYK